MRIHFEGDERSVLVARFGLPATASDTDIGSAVQSLLVSKAPVADPPKPPQVPQQLAEQQLDDEQEPDDDQLEGQVVLDPEAFALLNRRAAQASQLEEDARIARRDGLVAGAIKVGKFPPSRRDHYATLFDADPEGTERTIARLQQGVIPMESRGVEAFEEDINADEYPREWLPEATRSNGAGREARQSRVITED